MRYLNYLVFVLLLAFLFSCESIEKEMYIPSNLEIQNLPGQYRLNFHSDPIPESGWDYNRREELLTLNDDSTYLMERIRIQGAFQIHPYTGNWKYINEKVELDSYREFIIVKDGLMEPDCKEREDLSNVLWKKE